jgi:hypothetical protein
MRLSSQGARDFTLIFQHAQGTPFLLSLLAMSATQMAVLVSISLTEIASSIDIFPFKCLGYHPNIESWDSCAHARTKWQLDEFLVIITCELDFGLSVLHSRVF